MRRNRFEEPDNSISLSDIMLKVLLVIFFLYILASLQITIEKKNESIEHKAEFSITAEWNKERNPKIDCDVDLWVKNPREQIVSFKMKENSLMNIERDDLGSRNDFIQDANGKVIANPEDKEYWFLRGIIPGEYTVNVHLYTCTYRNMITDPFRIPEIYITAGKEIPAPITVEVVLSKLNPSLKIVTQQNVVLSKIWQEETAFQFTLLDDGEVSNISQIPSKIVTRAAQE